MYLNWILWCLKCKFICNYFEPVVYVYAGGPPGSNSHGGGWGLRQGDPLKLTLQFIGTLFKRQLLESLKLRLLLTNLHTHNLILFESSPLDYLDSFSITRTILSQSRLKTILVTKYHFWLHLCAKITFFALFCMSEKNAVRGPLSTSDATFHC